MRSQIEFSTFLYRTSPLSRTNIFRWICIRMHFLSGLFALFEMCALNLKKSSEAINTVNNYYTPNIKHNIVSRVWNFQDFWFQRRRVVNFIFWNILENFENSFWKISFSLHQLIHLFFLWGRVVNDEVRKDPTLLVYLDGFRTLSFSSLFVTQDSGWRIFFRLSTLFFRMMILIASFLGSPSVVLRRW